MGLHTDGTTVKGCQTLSAGGGSLKTGKGRVVLMLRVCEPRRVGVAVYLSLVLSVLLTKSIGLVLALSHGRRRYFDPCILQKRKSSFREAK